MITRIQRPAAFLLGYLIFIWVQVACALSNSLPPDNALGILELRFSLYGALLDDWDALASIVLETSDFLCVEVKVRVQGDASCLFFTNQSVVDLKTSTSDEEQENGLVWTAWKEEFWILELSEEIRAQADALEQNRVSFFQETVQEALEISIEEGRMNHQFQGTGVIWAVPGEEVETFQTYLDEQERIANSNRTDDGASDVEAFDPDNSHVLPIIGSILLVLNTMFVTGLRQAAKKRREKREQEEREAEEQEDEIIDEASPIEDDDDDGAEPNLASPTGVELLLETSRQNSLKLVGLTRQSDAEKSPDKSDVEIVLSPGHQGSWRKKEDPEEYLNGSLSSSRAAGNTNSSRRSSKRGSWSQIQRSQNDGSFTFDP
jgi:hypothetical protein